MSLVVVCDKCGKIIEDDDNRVILSAQRYKIYKPGDKAATTVPASAPPGTVISAPGGSGPMSVSGSSQQFMVEPAFGGQLEMHEKCWDKWITKRNQNGNEEVTDTPAPEEPTQPADEPTPEEPAQ